MNPMSRHKSYPRYALMGPAKDVPPVATDLDRRILDYLREEDWPVTTEMVARHLRVSWNTAQVHLYKLLAEGKIKGKRVGRQNQWAMR